LDPQTLALQAVGGFTIGAVIGYAARKLAKVLLLAIGVMLLPLALLWQAGVLYVNWSALNEVVGRVVMWVAGSVKSLEDALASAGVFGASALIGFFFGVASPALHSAAYKPSEHYRFVKRKVRESERGSKQT
jgi:uncharacterized membrane protein (Fun14 family)